MSLALHRMRLVSLRRRKEVIRDDQSGWQPTATEISATVQPLSGYTAAQMYGQRLSQTKLLLAGPDATIVDGMGVCVDVPADQPPDYKVVYVAGWTRHKVAHIQYIPEAERG